MLPCSEFLQQWVLMREFKFFASEQNRTLVPYILGEYYTTRPSRQLYVHHDFHPLGEVYLHVSNQTKNMSMNPINGH